MPSSSPIAIVGRACTLPGALSPEALWQRVLAGDDLLAQVPAGRWRLPPDVALSQDGAAAADRSWSDRGGYVTGFEAQFDSDGFLLSEDEIRPLDPVFQWTLHTAREAARDVKSSVSLDRTGAIFGNLSFPSLGMSQFAQSVWLRDVQGATVPKVDPRNRFSSGLPALVLEQALGLGRGALALDAACASSLYAIKLACDRLQDGDADMMLAGATNCADDLFIHIGFSALSALSRTGRSRPFHAEADGLVPAEGSAFLALKRLADAQRDGDVIHGVIRGVGLSNDGRGKGFLVPSRHGQVRALRSAYAASGIDPSDVSLVECHATGTKVGDATEVDTLREVFSSKAERLPLGSLKSNLGHLISAAGAAAVIKTTLAMDAGVRPKTLWTDQPLAALEGTPFRLLHESEPWDVDGPRRAGVSAFGFGGNNAHLVLEQYREEAFSGPAPSQLPGSQIGDEESAEWLDSPIAIVGIGVVAGDCADRASFLRSLIQGAGIEGAGIEGAGVEGTGAEGTVASGEARSKTRARRIDEIAVDVAVLAVPPNDLKQTLGQQLAIAVAGHEAAAEVDTLQSESMGLFVGMGVDAEIARYGLRWRLGESLEGHSAEALNRARDEIIPVLESAGVIGTMPNIPANRLNRMLDAGGGSCTVSCEEASGLEALRLAVRALQVGELSSALVGAVDLSCEEVHRIAKDQVVADAADPGDAAVALILKRLGDAKRDGDRIYAVIDETSLVSAEPALGGPGSEIRWGREEDSGDLTERFGDAHAASSLLHVAAGALALHHRLRPEGEPWLEDALRRVVVEVMPMHSNLVRRAALRQPLHAVPRSDAGRSSMFTVYEGANRAEVLAALKSDTPSSRWRGVPAEGARLVLLAEDPGTLQHRRQRALAHLENGAPAGTGVHFCERPVVGEVAFVYTSAGSAYRGMGRELLAAAPELGDRLAHRIPGLLDAARWMWQPAKGTASNSERLWGASVLSQLHTELTRGMLGLEPQAAIGYSSGETNSLIGMGAWTDGDAMRLRIEELGLYEPELGGRLDAVARSWQVESGTPRWAVWNVLAPVDEVEALLAAEERAHLAIVHTAEDCVVAGDESACRRVVDEIGSRRCHLLDYNIAAHVPEVDAYREEWLDIHRRHVTPVPGVRFYSAGLEAAYEPETERCAQAILKQACSTLDFRRVTQAAYDDGVRVFIEHGPRGSCTRWIRENLADRTEPTVQVALDREGGGLESTFDALAQLIAAGQPLDPAPLEQSALSYAESLAAHRPARAADAGEATLMMLPAHRPTVNLAAVLAEADAVGTTRRDVPGSARGSARSGTEPVDAAETTMDSMPPAPDLPSTLSQEAWPEVGSLSGWQASPSRPAVDTGQHQSSSSAIAAEPSSTAAPAHGLPLAAIGSHAVSDATIHADGSLPIPASSGADSLLGQQLAWINQVHRQFLDQQQVLHQQFLAAQQMGQVSDAGPGAMAATAGAAPVSPLATSGLAAAAAPAVETTVPMSMPASDSLISKPPTSAPPAAAAPLEQRAVEGKSATVASIETTEPESPELHVLATPKGLSLDRSQLEVHSSGKISSIYGPVFADQDQYARQVRMPEPPLLLADRVTGIDAEPGVHGTGVLWSETDVKEDSWYLHRGRMPAGVLIEAGQADLMLISYMGTDLLNRGDRVYRLLGCQLTFEDDLPAPGDTLQYEIHVDGHAKQDEVRLFFFHYDCVVNGRPRIRVRSGQAGFFSEAELAASAGVLWSPEEAEIQSDPQLDPPSIECSRSSFSVEQVQAFAEGRAWECFGQGFEFAQTHTLTPTIQTGDMLFLDEVTDFDSAGGPWGRGYLRAEAEIHSDDWFFDGHFKNDPCMPGTLMFEGCLQALAFYQSAMGFTVERDGWRFQPVKGEPIDMRCRGQVTPQSKKIIYEVFVEEVVAGPIPTVYADLLCTVDGQKAFHARRAGLQLVPSWPLEGKPELRELEAAQNFPGPVAEVATDSGETFRFDYDSLLACAWGRPSKAFGPMYQRFDNPMRVPRLPGPPYHFLSRVTKVAGPIGGMEVGSQVEVVYDVPPDAWYFDDNGARSMPFAVLLEAALQPCGWLASYIGSALQSDSELAFRNLDGDGTLLCEVLDGSGPLRTAVELTNISQSAGMIIVSFDVECFLGDEPVYQLKTVFGFFPPLALANQVGLPIGDRDRELCEQPSDFHIDLQAEPARYFSGSARLGTGRLRMLDEISGRWQSGDALASYRAERNIDPGDWYFKAHFFQDPVQPGSLGIEAMIQLIQFAMLEEGLDEGLTEPRFEPLGLDQPMQWKYRGQVSPRNQRVTVTLELTDVGRDDRGAYAVGSSSLWCDGIRIYCAEGLGMRLVEGAPPSQGPDSGASKSAVGKPEPSTTEGQRSEAVARPSAGRTDDAVRSAAVVDSAAVEVTANLEAATIVETLDPQTDTWLQDHCPTWNRPALPMMVIVDRLAAAARAAGPQDAQVVAVRDVRVSGWVDFPGPRTFHTEVRMRGDGQMMARLLSGSPTDAEIDEIASARVELGSYPEAPPSLDPLKGEPTEDLYASGVTFHGPAFQLLKDAVWGVGGATASLDAGAGSVPVSLLHPALLDAALHSIPHDHLHLWDPRVPEDVVAYPARVVSLRLFGEPPLEGPVRCEVRFNGFLAEPQLPRFTLQLISGEPTKPQVWAELDLVESCFPKGPLGRAEPEQRRAFLRDRSYVPGLSLSRRRHGETRLSRAEVGATDWMPGTVEGIYGTTDVPQIAMREHLAARLSVHPSAVEEGQMLDGTVTVTQDGEDAVVRDVARAPEKVKRQPEPPLERFDPRSCREPWARRLGIEGEWLGRDLMEGLLSRYVGSVRFEDESAFEALRGRGAIFLANHQVQIESILVTHILSALTDVPVNTVANAKHETRWIGWLLRRLFGYPGVESPGVISYFDQSDPGSMLGILGGLAPAMVRGERSFFAHTDGTRSQQAGDPVKRLSSVFLDLSVDHSLPVVPVRFTGGLPIRPIEGKLEFPVEHCAQDYTMGLPIAAEELAALPYKERRDRVLDALNSTGPSHKEDRPGPAQPAFSKRVTSWQDATGAGEVEATFFRILEDAPEPSEQTERILRGAASGELLVAAGLYEDWLASVARRLYGPTGPRVVG